MIGSLRKKNATTILHPAIHAIPLAFEYKLKILREILYAWNYLSYEIIHNIC